MPRQLQDELSQTVKSCGKPKRDYTFPREQSTDGKLTRFLSYRQGTLWFMQQPGGWTFQGVSRSEDSSVDLNRSSALAMLPCFSKVQMISSVPSPKEAPGEATRPEDTNKAAASGDAFPVWILLAAVLGVGTGLILFLRRMMKKGTDPAIPPTQSGSLVQSVPSSGLQSNAQSTSVSSHVGTRSIQSSEVELHTGGIDRAYRSLGMIEAKRSKRSALSQDPTLEEVNAELRLKAAKVGANAVLGVDYKRGMSLTSYGVLTARGEAVFIVADTKVCPECAETIKSAAIKCRFCGADLQTQP